MPDDIREAIEAYHNDEWMSPGNLVDKSSDDYNDNGINSLPNPQRRLIYQVDYNAFNFTVFTFGYVIVVLKLCFWQSFLLVQDNQTYLLI